MLLWRLFVQHSDSRTQWPLCPSVSVYTGRCGCFKSSCPSQARSFRAYMPLKCSAFCSSNFSIDLIYFLVNSVWLKRSCLKSFLKTLITNTRYLNLLILSEISGPGGRAPQEWSDEPCGRSRFKWEMYQTDNTGYEILLNSFWECWINLSTIVPRIRMWLLPRGMVKANINSLNKAS